MATSRSKLSKEISVHADSDEESALTIDCSENVTDNLRINLIEDEPLLLTAFKIKATGENPE